MSVVVIDYGSGNLRSVAKALERAATDGGLDVDVEVTSDPARVVLADHIVLPGVGAFADCKAGLDALSGMAEALRDRVIQGGRPFLGICVGMQLMAAYGHEHGTHAGLGWIDAEVVPLVPADPALKVPHMGWNELVLTDRYHPVLDRLPPKPHAYFVHSYHMQCADSDKVLAMTDHGGKVVAAVGQGTMVGTQFHPEKSQETGLAVLTNFLRWRP